MVLPRAEQCDGGGTELPTQRCKWARSIDLARDAKGDGEVLDHQVETKPAVKSAGQYELFEFLLRGAIHPRRCVQDVRHQRRVDAEFLTDDQSLDPDEKATRRNQIIQRLHRLAGPDRADPMDGRAHCAQDGIDLIEHIAVPSAHDGQISGDRSRHATAHGSVHYMHVERRQACGNVLRQRRHARSHVDDDLARPQLRPQTINNGGDVPARRQHRYDDVGLPGLVGEFSAKLPPT